MPITKLSKSISTLIQKKNMGSMILLGNIQNKWGEIVGPGIKEATAVVKIENKTVYIKCKNPTWKNELFYQKNEILKAIQKQTPKETIQNIYLI